MCVFGLIFLYVFIFRYFYFLKVEKDSVFETISSLCYFNICCYTVSLLRWDVWVSLMLVGGAHLIWLVSCKASLKDILTVWRTQRIASCSFCFIWTKLVPMDRLSITSSLHTWVSNSYFQLWINIMVSSVLML